MASAARKARACRWSGHSHHQDRPYDRRGTGERKPSSELAGDVVKRALAAGASDAECTISRAMSSRPTCACASSRISRSGSRGRPAHSDRRKTGASYTSDVCCEGIEHLVKSASSWRISPPRTPTRPARARGAGRPRGRLAALFAGRSSNWRRPSKSRRRGAPRSRALRRPAHFELRRRFFRLPRGPPYLRQFARFRGRLPRHVLLAQRIPVAREGDSMERDYWYTIARGFAQLGVAEEVGRTAAGRALRRSTR